MTASREVHLDLAITMPKKMSPQQIAANRRNALKSTGPRTARGRAVSKLNALKHGILSTQVLVQGQHGRESRAELKKLHARFRADLRPVGPVEEMLVELIFTAHWRLRRALLAESGAIALNVDEGHWNRTRGLPPEEQWLRWSAYGDPIPQMQASSLGNQILESWLRQVRAAVEQAGELTDAATQIPFHGQPNHLSRQLVALRERLAATAEDLTGEALRERNRREVLAWLDGELRRALWRKGDCARHEAERERSQQAADVLPSAAELDKILRYETKLERQLYRALAQLERVQRMRRGEALPAPLSVDLSGPG